MLILSRKPNESLMIEMEGLSEPIEIIVTDLNANQVRLGIQAPQGCKILRKELWMTVQYNKQAASSASASGIRGVASRLAVNELSPDGMDEPDGKDEKVRR